MKKIYLILIGLFIVLMLLFVSSKSNFGESNLEDKLYNGEKWYHYRLGDVYFHGENENVGDLGYHLKDYPGSIASELLKNYKTENKELLMELIKKQNIPKFNDSDLVLHVRTGDVMCLFDNEYLRYSRKNDEFWWNKVIKYIQLKGIKKVYIVSGTHQPHCLKDSADYLENRKNFIINGTDVEVEFRVGKNPDEDIAFCLSAPYFISTGGGFGKMVYKIKNISFE
jgi:hypothetical protein